MLKTKTVVKTVTEFRQVARYMFLADAMTDALNSVFHAANDDIEPVERFYSLRITTISNEMNMTAISKGMEAAKTIGITRVRGSRCCSAHALTASQEKITGYLPGAPRPLLPP